MNDIQRMLTMIAQEPWAILPSALSGLVEQLRAGVKPLAPAAALPRDMGRRTGAIAVLPVMGIIRQRPSSLEEMFGFSLGTTTEGLIARLRRAAADPEIKAIVLDVDSPGGTAAGVQEAADELFAIRGVKPIVAVADSLAASAAYWIASQADEVIASPSAEIGSIGVMALHEDITGLADQLGVKVTLITAGKYKAVGSEFEPLTEETEGLIQGLVDDVYGQFVASVARGRGVSASTVRDGFGEGFIVGAKQAVKLGMADRVATLRETLVRLGASEDGAREAMRAETPALSPQAEVEIEVERLKLRERDLTTPLRPT